MDVLTRDNPPLSQPKNVANPDAEKSATTCIEATTPTIADLVRESLAPNTRAAHLSDLAHFLEFRPNLRPSPHTSLRTLKPCAS